MKNFSKVAVVGAVGGVGRQAVKALRNQGLNVVAIDRRDPTQMSELKDIAVDPNVEWHMVNIEEDPLEELFQDVNAVVNCAGDVGLSETYTEIAGSNVVGVDRLFNAAKTCSVEQFIHLSCGTLYEGKLALFSEADSIEPTNDFARSKYDAEMIFRHSQPCETHWTILRPSYVYGPGCTSMAAGLVTLPPNLGDFLKYQIGFRSGARTTWCHVEDLAAAIISVLGNNEAYEEIYNVADNTPQSAGECITSITEAYGLQIGLVLPLPSNILLTIVQHMLRNDAMVQGLQSALRQLWRRNRRFHMLKTPLKPRINAQAAYHIANDLILDNRKLTALGWKPKYPSFSAGIPSTIEWYQKEGWVPNYDPAVLKRLNLEAKPSLFSFEQTLSGELIFADGYLKKIPRRRSLKDKKKILQRLDLSEESEEERLGSDNIVIQLEVTLRNLFHGNGDIKGEIWIGGITSQAVKLSGTYNYNLRKNAFSIDFGFKDNDDYAYRASLVGKREGYLFAVTQNTFPKCFTGKIIDCKGELVGTVRLNVMLAETLLSILFGLR